MKTKKYKVIIKLKTGLHIWAGNNNVAIWEMDNPVVKTRNGFPYIPWSSLKGKLRSLYEMKENKIWSDWWPYQFDWENYDEISMFFGKAGKVKDNLENLWPTRFIFRDLYLASEKLKSDKKLEDILDDEKLYFKEDYENWQKEWEELTEEKWENVIDRNIWATKQWWLRQIERVFANTVFIGDLIVRFFEKPTEDEELENFKKFGENLEELKKLLENDYLWWGWTRGNGQVEIDFICIENCE